MMYRRARFFCASLLALGFVAPCVRGETITVNVFSFDFSTGMPTDPIVDPIINVGDTVRWRFLSAFHSSTSVFGIAEQWDSGFILAPDATYDHMFTHAGRFEYYCLPHGMDNGDGTAGGMSGVITVVPAPGAAGLLVVAGVMSARRRCPRKQTL